MFIQKYSIFFAEFTSNCVHCVCAYIVSIGIHYWRKCTYISFCTYLQVALWTLGQVIESTAYVVEPYQKYPNLLDILLSFLRSEQTVGMRREVRFFSFMKYVNLQAQGIRLVAVIYG